MERFIKVGPPPGDHREPEASYVPSHFDSESIDEMLYEKAISLLNSKNERISYAVWHDMMEARGLLRPPPKINNIVAFSREAQESLAGAFKALSGKQNDDE